MNNDDRFEFDPSIYHFTDKTTGKTYCEYNLDEVVDMLNNYEKKQQQLCGVIRQLIRDEFSLKDALKSSEPMDEEKAALISTLDIIINTIKNDHWNIKEHRINKTVSNNLYLNKISEIGYNIKIILGSD